MEHCHILLSFLSIQGFKVSQEMPSGWNHLIFPWWPTSVAQLRKWIVAMVRKFPSSISLGCSQGDLSHCHIIEAIYLHVSFCNPSVVGLYNFLICDTHPSDQRIPSVLRGQRRQKVRPAHPIFSRCICPWWSQKTIVAPQNPPTGWQVHDG